MDARRKNDDDLVLIHGVDERRKELHVLRHRAGKVEPGVVRGVEEGQPITGDLVRLRPRAEFPLLCDVETILTAEEMQPDATPRRRPGRDRLNHPGPARVTSDAYREGWERIFGVRPDDSVN